MQVVEGEHVAQTYRKRPRDLWVTLSELRGDASGGCSQPSQELHDGQPQILVCVVVVATRPVEPASDTDGEVVHVADVDAVVTLQRPPRRRPRRARGDDG